MDLTLKGRGVHITDQLRGRAEHKLAKLARLDPGADRVEIEVIAERASHRNGTKRIEATVTLRGHVVRASASAQDADAALDLLADRLERQVRDYRDQRAKR